MNRLFNWIKTHKLLVILALVIFFLLFKDSLFTRSYSLSQKSYDSGLGYGGSPSSMADYGVSPSLVGIGGPAPPAPEVKERMVVQNSNISLLVDNVVDVQKKIIKKAQELGGYMVSTSLRNPQDVASSTVTVRVPSIKLESALEYYRSLSQKVVSESLLGYDVTDQYVDNEARLEIYAKTKAKYESILDKATLVKDILEVQKELTNIQSSIDYLKGQQIYLEKTAEMSKITIYIAADELELPYAPSEAWRPQVIFKKAVRSLIGTFRSIGSLAIWLGTYSVVWIPALIVVVVVRKRRKRNTSEPKGTDYSS